MRKTITTLAFGGLLIGALLGNASAKPTAVITDVAGDAGVQSQALAVPGADQAGFDIVGGSIEKVGANLEFTTTSAAMPPNGALPEGFRYMWHFDVGGTQYRLTIKSADIGKPDAAANSGTERVGRVDTAGHFRLETCSEQALPAVLTLINCNAIEYVEGAFDPAAKSFTAIVPLKTLKAKAGSVVLPGTGGATGTGCQVCWVPHYGERSLTPHTIIDNAVMAKSFKVPKK
jgi:hypothetical protein